MSLEMPERKCRVCGEMKSPAQFSKDASKRDGLRSRCKACDAAQCARYRAKNAAKNATQDPAAIANLPERKCTVCGVMKSPAQFPKNASTRDGLSRRCKTCAAAQSARYRAERKNDPEYRRKVREQHARHRAKNVAVNAVRDPYADPTPKRCPECDRDLLRAAFGRDAMKSDGLRVQCRSCDSRRASDWARNNPEKVRARNRRRRARKRENGVVPYDEADVWAAYNHACIACGAPGEHVDHFQPIAKGGADALVNVVILCEACNLSKNARDPIEFLASRGIRFNRVLRYP